MGKKIRNGLAFTSMILVFTPVSINLYFLYLGLEGQEKWQCIDELIFFSSSLIMCLSMLTLFITVCVFDIFNPLIGMIVFIYLMMWLLCCVAVVTSDYPYYWVNLAMVIAAYVFLTIFTMCITACYMDHKYRSEQIKEEAHSTVPREGGKPNCYRIPLTGPMPAIPSTRKIVKK
nr:unnamed protein product [Callosobruchus chinensis]